MKKLLQKMTSLLLIASVLAMSAVMPAGAAASYYEEYTALLNANGAEGFEYLLGGDTEEAVFNSLVTSNLTTFEQVDVTGMPFSKAINIVANKSVTNVWDRNFQYYLESPVTKGDKVLVRFFAKSTSTSNASISMGIKQLPNYADWGNYVGGDFTVTPEWKEYTLNLYASADATPGDENSLAYLECIFYTGVQQLMIGGLTIVNLKDNDISLEEGTMNTKRIEDTEYDWDSVQIGGGGYVPNIIFNEGEANVIYARTDMGGAYRWNESVQEWEPLTDFTSRDDWNLMGIESIATDKKEPNRLYLACGTYTNDWTSQNGYIYCSEDYGDTFEKIELPFKLGSNEPARNMGERLAIDPVNNNILYLATRLNGLWRSTDYGRTWEEVTSFPVKGDLVENNFSAGLSWVVFDENTSNIYVGACMKNANTVYCSTDGGSTWNALAGQPNQGYYPARAVISENGCMYITYMSSAGPSNVKNGTIWRYNLTTKEWKDVSPETSNGFGYCGISVDRQNPDTLIAASFTKWWPTDQIYLTKDGGETWTTIWDNNANTRYYEMDYEEAPWVDWGGDVPGIGSWISGIAIDPFNSDRMMYGTGAGIYGTNNLTDWRTDTPVVLSFMAAGLEETAVLDLASPPGEVELYSAMGDIDGFRHDDVLVAPENDHNPPYTTTVCIDFAGLNPDKVVKYANVQNAYTNVSKSIAYSTDGGKTWYESGANPSGTVVNDGLAAISADGSTIIASKLGTYVKPAYSTDNGTTWTTINSLPNNACVIADKVDPNVFYAYLDTTFYVSRDKGLTFTASSAAIPSGSNGEVVFDRSGSVWFAGNGNLSFTNDYGETFTKVNGLGSVESVGFGKAADGADYPAIYAVGKYGIQHGVFCSLDAGKTWSRVNDDQHQYGNMGSCITGDPDKFGRLYLATNGRGIIFGDISLSALKINSITASHSGSVKSGTPVTWMVNVGGDSENLNYTYELIYNSEVISTVSSASGSFSKTLDTAGVYSLKVTVTDGTKTVSKTSVKLNVTQPLTFDSVTQDGDTFTFNVSGGADGKRYSCYIISDGKICAKSVYSLNNSFTVSSLESGSYTLVVYCDDSAGERVRFLNAF